ncbi:LPS-assembly protein LptD [Candidatus Nitrospira allomarina]|uniref:LPS assembly protein LptD n=1 Tax=Candidatus Nitrospira allomarina TaxID=3020900 RepID=A0AA96JVC0_9BACT|nr:LPS assembly protein LptD [Candidatus Nitrospira allomarina]WNM56746.1 LPS assembly protein LptD [Candidatus Nitrospira allomarina]
MTYANLGDDRCVLSRRSHGLILGILIFITILTAGETVFGQSDASVVESEEVPAASSAEKDSAESTSQGVPVTINADRIEYDNDREEYHATGAVDITRGPIHLNADEATLQKLTGRLTARGHVHLRDVKADIWSEELELNLNTEAGVITNGNIFLKEQNSFVTGRRLQRFSETHYRIKEGSFTNCDAKNGEIPAWRFNFHDMDVEYEDSLFGKGVWFNVNDVPVIPLPTFRYPLGASRKSGFLFPTTGYNTQFGYQYRQGYFWAINPSNDLTISPQILTERGGGADLEYRYMWNRLTKGEWLIRSLYDTQQHRGRAEVRGAHAQQFNPDLSLRMRANFSSDRTVLQNFSSSGTQRALPSQESHLTILQRLDHGAFYLTGQYIQPLATGGNSTFQRLPEIGHRFMNPSVLGSPISLTAETTAVQFHRQTGFDVGRIDVMPGLSMEGLHLGHALGFRPQVKFREVGYTRGLTEKSAQHRETFWVGAELFSNVSKRFSFGDGNWIRHSLQPNVIYEYVPQTKQSELVQIDAVDDLIQKSLVTYSLKNRLSQIGGGKSNAWLDLFFAQSYHVANPPPLASRFSDIWTRGHFHSPVDSSAFISAFNLRVDAFYDPNRKYFSQMNTDVLIQSRQTWYMTVGQRYTKEGTRVRRGDIWNPVSFNEVLAPDEEILYLTTGGGVRLPYGVTVGTKWYHDLRTGQTAEWDVVGLYQNPCRCFSLGLTYTRLPDRSQFEFLISLTGLWGTQGHGTQLMKLILGPIMAGERGIPWDYR